MRSTKSKRNGKRKARGAWTWAAAGAALLAALLALALYSEGRRVKAPAAAAPTTTAWPYGQPEYVIEVPKGYEDLLPAAPGSGKAENQGPAAPAGDAGQKTAGRAQSFVARRGGRRAGQNPVLIFVIDDAGYNLGQLKPFLALPFPLTVAVLPGVEHSAESARLAREAGKEVILHQPMEAIGGKDPGPAAIALGMEGAQAASVLASNLDSLPEAVGVNNHMGSAVTRDRAIMKAVLELVKARGIYYLDSLTAPGTATGELSAELALPLWERDVFLDNSGDRQSILNSLEEGKKLASSKGASVLIGHVWSAELAQTLMDIYPRLVEEGYSLSTISKFMLKSTEEDGDARPRD